MASPRIFTCHKLAFIFPYQLVDFASIPCQIRLAVGGWVCVCFCNLLPLLAINWIRIFITRRSQSSFIESYCQANLTSNCSSELLHFNLYELHFDNSSLFPSFLHQWERNFSAHLYRHATKRRQHFLNYLWIINLCASHWLDSNQTKL